ncbi:carbonic anhydrase 1-like [Belonocnema kinseyi]|uniref:carbonic anhydrase 1-like n=1 Tax=Belonocnema kinseyi TaxID=2817044 RepID=UPI00143DBE93|nr:carbonic anhydrase 1-like [Belonocnema kinseyi]
MYLQYLIATILFSPILGTSTFTFKDAKNWGKHYPGCNGKLQSPMADDAKKMIGDSQTIENKLIFTDSEKLPTKIIMKNTGRTVELKGVWAGKPPKLSGGPLKGTYVFEKIDFRWAPKEWTEVINVDPQFKSIYMQYMNMHVYFYKEDLKSFKKAETQKDGLAAFKLHMEFLEGVLLLKDLEKNIHKVQSINSTAELHPIPLASFAYRDGSEGSSQSLFYKGSLDYPPCSESVTWFEPVLGVSISEGLLNGFRKIKLEGGDVSNVRPLQPINKRPIKWVTSNKWYEI